MGGIGATKEPALQVESPVSEGTQDSDEARVADPLVDESLSCANPSQLQSPRIDEHNPSGPVQGTRKWGQR